MSGLSGLRIPFGERDRQLFSPDLVDRGLACNCACPGCGGALVANHPRYDGQPRYKRPYFSHHQASNCKGGPETAIHKMAKQVIVEAGRVGLPDHTVRNIAPLTLGATIENHVRFPARECQFKSVAAEVKDDSGLVPDLTAVLKNDATLHIEIFVTHAVEEKKATILDNLMEIDLSRLSDEDLFDAAAFSKAVLSEAPRRWHRVSLYDELDRVRAAQQKLNLQAEDELRRRSISEKDSSPKQPLSENPKIDEWTIVEFWNRIDKAGEWLEGVKSGDRDFELEAHSANSIKFARTRLAGFIADHQWPDFLNVEIDNDCLIQIDRRVWQAFIFEQYVLAKEVGTSLDLARITDSVLNVFGLQNDLSMARKFIQSDRNRVQLTQKVKSLLDAPELVVNRYLDELDKRFGILKYDLATHQYTIIAVTAEQALLELKRRRDVARYGHSDNGKSSRPGEATLKALLGDKYYQR